ncbi:xylosyltransferase oxt-like [Macrobrachium nipponense]|uniref:xylosyltransferase oxt-like n=1 Tax=Macrobrachium nipponense TaxID=159736 RepID=UPI0030C87C47
MAIAPARAIIIVSFNIFRVVCRKYGIYLLLGMVMILLQGFSGYYVLRLGVGDSSPPGSKVDPDHYLQKRDGGGNGNFHQTSDRADADTHDKGPPIAEEIESLETIQEHLGVKVPCFLRSKEAVSAIKRATTSHCRSLIANISCQIQSGSFYPSRLQSYCPSNGRVRGKSMGCFVDSREKRILRGHAAQLKRNTPNICADICYQRGYVYAGVQYGKECFCGNEELPMKMKVSDALCAMPCTGDANLFCGDYLHMNIYETGLAKYVPKALNGPSDGDTAVRIAFILTVNGRAVRQFRRLFKALYHKDHYFYIHVDSRQDYLHREVLKLEQQFTNIKVSHFRLSTIWGGASLLTILLHCMKQVLLMKTWEWDFVINLSESDYPIKTNEELVKFLTSNRERNFLKSHGHDTNKFLQKQGLDRTFLECETHMWRIGERKLPFGIRVDGGSDWLCLNRGFVDYVVNSKDQLVTGLKKIYSYTLLPAESFFHTVLRNSKFCQTFTDNNLHVTNWKRKLGCKCQYKHIVDWCGCSPNDFTTGDWPKLEASASRNLFFARKFEAVINQAVINQVDAWLYTPYYSSTQGLESYWENRYHHEDRPAGSNDVSVTLYNAAARLSTKTVTQLLISKNRECHLYASAVLEANSYQVSDEFKGILVQYVGNIKNEASFNLETWFFPHNKYRPPFDKSVYRIISVEVGSDFDVKEQVFRNLGGALGPNSDITVITRWTGAKSDNVGGEEEEEETVQQPLLLLMDPVGAKVAEEITLEAGDQVVSHKFDMHKPLLPGSWSVRVIIDNVVIATHTFVVLPYQFMNGRQITIKEARMLHKGPSGPYKDDETSIHHLNYPGNSSAMEIAVAHSHLYGPELSEWIDDLVNRFYTVQDTCYIPSEHVPECVRNSLEPCPETNWSSLSPDPKSELVGINPNSGKILDPHRVGSSDYR